MNDDANPYEGLVDAVSQWEGRRPTEPLTLDSLRALYDQMVREDASHRPNFYSAYCSRCNCVGLATVGGDQAEWHGCKPKP